MTQNRRATEEVSLHCPLLVELQEFTALVGKSSDGQIIFILLTKVPLKNCDKQYK